MRSRLLNYTRHVAGSLVPLLGLASVWPMLAIDLNPKQVGIYVVNSQTWQVASVSVSGTHAYVIATDYDSVQESWVGNLLILDIANPVQPALVGTYRLPNPGGGSVTVRNDLAYLAAGGDGVLILNVSDPKAPRRISSYKTSQAYDVFLVGNYAYIPDSYAGLLILDVSNPASPRRVGGLVSEHEAMGVFVAGRYAYLAEVFWNDSELRSEGTLEIMDISNPASPQLVGSQPIGSGPYNGIFVAGGVAYVCANGTEMFNVSDPANAAYIGNYGVGGRGVLVGNRAYICGGGGGMHILDLSQPSSPKRVGGYQPSGSAWGLGVGGQYAYVGISGQGLAVLDLDAQANLPRVGNLSTAGNAGDVALSGTRAYVADSVGGMQIVDITDPWKPAFLGNYAMANPAQLVAARGNYAFVVETWKIAVNSYGYALHVVDVSNPVSPAQLGVYQSSGWASIHALAVNDTGDYAFLSVPNDYPSPGSRIEVIDLRARSDPRLVTAYDTGDGGRCYDLALHGQQLIVAQKNLLVLDVSDPANPQPLGTSADYGWGGSHIALSGTRAYVASSAGFQAFDLSDPAHPAILGTSPDFGVGWDGLAVFSNYVYAAASASGVQVVDVADPTRLRLLGGNSAVLASDLAISGNNVFVAGGPEGLQVFDLAVSNPPSPGHLDITRSGSSLVISWPASITGAVLESTSQLTSSPAWVSAAETPVVSGNQNVVTVAVGTGTRFFRLRQ